MPTGEPPDPTSAAAEDVGPAAASTLVAACEAAWIDIRHHHSELPDAVIVLGSGVQRGRLVKLGHWWGGQWVADGQVRGEVLLAGEALHLEPARVFEVLLHEAAHGLNAARGIKDTSRGGRYHNERFAATAREVLLRVRALPPYGLAATHLTPAALDRYDATINHLGEAMRIARQLRADVRIGAQGGDLDGTGVGGRTDGDRRGGRRPGATATSCGCGRKMRMAPAVLAAGPVLCGLCDTEFAATAQRTHGNQASAGDSARADGVVDHSFLRRRQAVINTDANLRSVTAREAPIDGRARLEEALRTGLLPQDRLDAEGRPSEPDRHDERVGDRDRAALRRWYATFGTLDEQPMPVSTAEEAARRERLARAVLKADGTLRGPVAISRDGLEVQAGDRVQLTVDHDGMPSETLGTIEHVDPATGELGIDFGTLGRLRTNLQASLFAVLRHDYTQVAAPEIDLPGVEP